MPLKYYKPTTPGRRFASVLDFSELTRKRPEKALSRPLHRKAGRNAQGFITCRHKGGGHKRRYRIIDFKRDKDGIPARVAAIEYDPNRSAWIALLHYADGEKRYILRPDGVKVGETLMSGPGVEPKPGNAMCLKDMPLGLTIHAVEMEPGRGAQLVRSAGLGATLMAREKHWALIALPSGEVRRVPAACKATIGQVGNADHMNVRIGKAGRNRWRGIRPTVRGVAQNPVSHPLGGGEGRSGGGRHPCSPTGKLAKGGKTRRRRKPSNRHIIRRRPKGPHVG